jgi:hypothetical protein
MSYKPTDTFIPSNANGYFSDDSSGAAKSYKFSITKPTTYPGEETTNGIIWLLDLEAYSNNNLNRAQSLAGRDFKIDPTGKTFYTTKGNYYIFVSIFSFPEKNTKNSSELHDPFNNVQVRDGVRLIRLDLGSSLSRVEYGELKPSYTVDNIIDLALDYIKNTYIDIVYGRKTSTKWLEAIKENSGLSTEEIRKVYDDIGKLVENKVSFFIDNNEPENIPENIQETDTNKSEDLKNIIFNVQKEGIFSNSKFGELRLIGESGVNTDPGFNFGDEDDLSDLLLDDEFREEDFSGLEDVPFEIREDLQKIDNIQTPTKTETLSVDYNNPRFVGGGWKNYQIDKLISDIKSTKHGPNQKFTESLRKILLWIKQDKDITDAREASYLLATAYAESGYSLQRWEADYVCSGQGIPYGSNGPCSSALNYFRSTKNKKDYYTLGIDSRGFPYFGRGLIQLTGKSNYESYGKKIGVDLVSNGDLALKEDNSYKISVIYLVGRTFKHVKSNNLTQARKSVNGGTNGLSEVNGAYNDWLRIFKKYTEQEAIV